jgi:tetratricopeptide (TPR) repeat protein
MILNKKLMIIFLLVSGFLSHSVSVFAAEQMELIKTKADTNREVAMTYAQIYVEQKLFDEAENALLMSLKNDGENGTILNYLGLIQLQQRNYSQACYSFQTASIVFQDLQNRVYALYNLADCLHQGGRKQDSMNVLKDLVTKEEGISNSAKKTLELIEVGVIPTGSSLPPFQRHARGQFRLSGALSGGFDTNVLLVEEAVASGTAVNDRGSFYYTPTVQFGLLGRVFGQAIDARVVSAYTNYVASNATAFNNLYNRMDLYFGTNSVRWDFFSDVVFLNSGSFAVYNYDVGLMWQNVVKKGANSVWTYEIPLRYQKFILASGTSTDNDRSGGDIQARVSYRSQWSENEMYTIGGYLDNQYSIGKNYRLSGLTIPFSMALEVPGFKNFGLLNTFMAELSGQLYWQSDTNRRDYSYKLGAGLVTPLFETWNLNLDFYYMKNNSNVDAATYSKGVSSFLLSHNFL